MEIFPTAITLTIVFAAGLLQSLSGFGFCLLALPLMTLFIPTREVVPMLVILSVFLNVAVAYEAREHLDIKSIWPLLLTGACFTPLGAWLLAILPETTLKIIVGATTCLGGLLLLAGLRLKVGSEKPWLFPIGALSGTLGGSISLNGPPVVLFLTAVGKDKHTFRATMAGYFFLLNAIAVPSHAIAGLISRQVLELSALCLLPLIAGIGAGISLAGKVRERVFRKLVIAIVLATGALAMASALHERVG